MELIRHTKTARLRGLKMYREDLDQLVALFQKSCAASTISDNKNSYVSLDEMKANVGSKISDLDIRGEKPGLHFLLNQKEFAPGASTPAIFNELRTEEITDEAEALFFKVKEFLDPCQRSTRTSTVVLTIAIACLIGAFVLARNSATGQVHMTPPIVISLVVVIVCLFFRLAINRNHLLLETKLNSRSFFARNREDFAKHAVTAAISVIVGGIIGWFARYFLK